MRALKITLATFVVLVVGYVGAGLLVAWLANARQAELEGHLVRLTGYGQAELAELAGVTDAMDPVVQACEALPKVSADQVVQYLGPPPASEPAATGQALAIDFDHLSAVRDGRLTARPGSTQPQVPGLGARLGSVLTAAPWTWGQLVGGQGQGPALAEARYLIVARPTLLPKPGGAADSPVGGMIVMQVAVLDAASGQERCRGGLADRRPAARSPKIVEVLALHHLCALGGPSLCQVTDRRLNADP